YFTNGQGFSYQSPDHIGKSISQSINHLPTSVALVICHIFDLGRPLRLVYQHMQWNIPAIAGETVFL
ncbi:MAG TPA: hypothetical protein PLG24_07555, partial [Saprospiraceae bacterium]|nr:hypothetical protein [Saprospiraceae bacterium]